MFSSGEARGEREGGELPRKPVTTVATEAMAIVETLKGEDMVRLIVGFLRIYCFFAFLRGLRRMEVSI